MAITIGRKIICANQVQKQGSVEVTMDLSQFISTMVLCVLVR